MTLQSAVHTTDDVITYVRRYLSTTQQPFTVDNVVECIANDHLMLSLAQHNRIVDKKVEDAIEKMPDDEYWRGHADGYDQAVAELEDLATRTKNDTQTPAA